MSRRIDPKSERSVKSSDCRLPELHVMNNNSWAHSGLVLLRVVLNYPAVVHGFKARYFLDGGYVFCPCAFRGQI